MFEMKCKMLAPLKHADFASDTRKRRARANRFRHSGERDQAHRAVLRIAKTTHRSIDRMLDAIPRASC